MEQIKVALAVNGPGSPYEGAFDTLVAAVLAADPAVLETLTGKGQFTVFAPTDDAFEALGLTPENVGGLDQGALTNILLYHVAKGRRDAGDVVSSDRVRTLSKGFLYPSESATLTDEQGIFGADNLAGTAPAAQFRKGHHIFFANDEGIEITVFGTKTAVNTFCRIYAFDGG